VLAAGLLLALDLNRAPEAQATTRAALWGIHVYQATIAPLYARAGVVCRFNPTCSH
jgi:putative component of membrane protein insertase Oxa1/YidC/SpoIIIJ protein YidD